MTPYGEERSGRYRIIIVNLLIAVGISLIVNFSIFIFKLMPTPTGTGAGPGGGGGMHYWMRVSEGPYQTIQFFYYVVLAFVLLTVATVRLKEKGSAGFLRRLAICIAIAFVFYFIAPRMTRQGDMTITLYARRIFEPTLMLKVSFTLIVSVLYGKIYELVYQKQHIILENEVLKNENLQTTYNTLINQINPHFFFNSLNSLAMLVREKHNDQALIYLDRLSDTYRYILQNGQKGGTTLEQELKFLDAYKYLLEVRYEGKIQFETEIEPALLEYTLPSFSLQPLIENVVKHNTITKAHPMRVTITARGRCLTVANRIAPKIVDTPPSGIGLRNLSQRFLLLTGKDITITDDGDTFSVSLPLTPNDPEDEHAA